MLNISTVRVDSDYLPVYGLRKLPFHGNASLEGNSKVTFCSTEGLAVGGVHLLSWLEIICATLCRDGVHARDRDVRRDVESGR